MLQSGVPDASAAEDSLRLNHAVAGLLREHWLRVHRLPKLIVTPELRILWANDAAQALLDERSDLAMVGDALMLGDARQTHRFCTALSELGATLQALLHRRRMTEAYFIISAERLQVEGMPPAIALVLHSTTAHDRYIWADIRTVFELTRSEVVVVRLLIDGNGADQISHRLGISIETVRTHIRRVYAKTGVISREQLFQAVLPFRLG